MQPSTTASGTHEGARAPRLSHRLRGFLILVAAQTSRANYLAPAYPMLLAAGAVAIERWSLRRRWRWLEPAALGLLLIGGAVTAPMAIPLLPEEAYIAYARAIGIEAPREEHHERAALPQYFADRHGWDAMVQTVVLVYRRLPQADQALAGIFASNYGEAGAIDALAADPDAVLFRRHYVQGNWTKPSTASLFTGLFVHQHGVTMGHEPMEGGERRSPQRFKTHVLDDRF